MGAARPGLMLGLATVGFAVNFWAWALLSPLGPKFKDVLHLTPVQQALVVAVPVVVGSLGRIPVGALTDRYGGGPAPRRPSRKRLGPCPRIGHEPQAGRSVPPRYAPRVARW